MLIGSRNTCCNARIARPTTPSPGDCGSERNIVASAAKNAERRRGSEMSYTGEMTPPRKEQVVRSSGLSEQRRRRRLMAMSWEIERQKFDFVIDDCKRYFGQWDECDAVSWAILRVVQAQNDFSRAMELYAYNDVSDRVIEEAIAERIKSIAALQQAIKKEPRGFL
jgi:hypothetical protein